MAKTFRRKGGINPRTGKKIIDHDVTIRTSAQEVADQKDKASGAKIGLANFANENESADFDNWGSTGKTSTMKDMPEDLLKSVGILKEPVRADDDTQKSFDGLPTTGDENWKETLSGTLQRQQKRLKQERQQKTQKLTPDDDQKTVDMQTALSEVKDILDGQTRPSTTKKESGLPSFPLDKKKYGGTNMSEFYPSDLPSESEMYQPKIEIPPLEYPAPPPIPWPKSKDK